MKKLFSPNGAFSRKAVIVGAALAVVVALSYFGSGDYLNQSIMDMLMGGSGSCSCGKDNCAGAQCPDGSVCQPPVFPKECPEDYGSCVGGDCTCPDYCPHASPDCGGSSTERDCSCILGPNCGCPSETVCIYNNNNPWVPCGGASSCTCGGYLCSNYCSGTHCYNPCPPLPGCTCGGPYCVFTCPPSELLCKGGSDYECPHPTSCGILAPSK